MKCTSQEPYIALIDMHSWDSKAYEYKVVDSPPTSVLTELDAYAYVVRTRIGGYTGPYTVIVTDT